MNHKHIGAKFIIKQWGKYYICDICGLEFQSLKRKVVNFLFWRWQFYCQAGERFIADINGLWNMMGGGAMGIIGYQAVQGNLWKLLLLPAIWFGQKLVVFVLGFMDITYWHIFQNQAVGTLEFYPPQIETLRILNELRDKIIPEKKQPSILDNFKK